MPSFKTKTESDLKQLAILLHACVIAKIECIYKCIIPEIDETWIHRNIKIGRRSSNSTNKMHARRRCNSSLKGIGLLSDRYTFCQKCFNDIPGDTVTLGDDPTQPQT